MNANLLALAREAMGGDFSKLAAQFVGESPAATESALGKLLPAVIGGVAQKGATPEGASSLLSLINSSNLDTNMLGNLAGMFGSGGAGVNSLMKLGTSSLVPALFGDKAGGLVSALSSASGIKGSSATNLLATVVPIVLMFLKKFIGQNNLNAGSLATLFKGQGQFLSSSLDSRLTSALGFANPTAFLGNLGGAAADTAKRAGAAVAGSATAVGSAAATATKSGLMRWLPWLIGLGVLFLLWQMFAGKTPAPVPAPKVAAPAVTAPAPAAALLLVKVYFDVGSAAVGADEGKKVTTAADAIKKDNLKVSLTGYTDKTGDVAANETLAKSRATAVRDALVAAGVAAANVEMKAPIFVEVGSAGGDAEARRVEIGKQ